LRSKEKLYSPNDDFHHIIWNRNFLYESVGDHEGGTGLNTNLSGNALTSQAQLII